MRPLILTAVFGMCALLSLAATAQSGDIVLLDLDAGEPVDAAVPDAAAADATEPDAGGGSILIEGINSEMSGEPELVEPPGNDRAAMQADIIALVKWCIAARTVEVSNVDVGFMYLVRKGRPVATLTEVLNDEALHISRLHVDALRLWGEARAVDIGPERRMFVECIETVSLSVVPIVTERLSFRIRRGALTLLIEDLAWTPFQ